MVEPLAKWRHCRALVWSTGAFLAGVLLHAHRVPLWTTLIAILCAAWAIAARVRGIPLPGRYVRAAMAIVVTGVVLLMFRTLNGLAAGTALLIVVGAVKLLETTRRRDRYIVIGAALFLLLAACLQQQALPYVPLYAAHGWLCCTALAISAHPRSALSDRAAAGIAARALGTALPLAALLFLLFPRLSSSLWALPRTDVAATGLADTLSPGSITELIASGESAFRVWFESAPPPPEQRYWRGPGLHDFDGTTWSGMPSRLRPPPHLAAVGPAYRYRITLEPSQRTWWFTLDTVDAAPEGAHLNFDHMLEGAEPVSRRTSYTAVSHTMARALDPLQGQVRERDLRLPPLRNPRTQQLAADLRRRAASDAEFVRSVLELLRTGGFAYTLTPPPLGSDSVDDFLFRTRSGFCGHFASAFVTLMRSGHVPAHIVTGYLGGEWNPIGGYFLIRASDAHAWAEIWLEGRGWVRVDPTAVVAPERLRHSVLDLLPSDWAPQQLLRRFAWLNDAQQAWDAVNAWWSSEFIGFNLRSQFTMLERLGFATADWRPLAWLLTLALSAWLLLLAWQFGGVPRAHQPDRLARAYQRLCGKLAAAGIERAPHEGPLSYAATLAARRPDLARELRALLERYAELRFGPNAPGDGRAIAAFEQAVLRLRVTETRSRQ
ncbi:MAG TPA: DUF3488 and transglutaminase-like domain-containing protein [Steroidobacteraceae bacterium]|nr:DUF3488 and transglutaminase-like domain-containing protein [Steroidobacteraceae bacterium]